MKQVISYRPANNYLRRFTGFGFACVTYWGSVESFCIWMVPGTYVED